MAIKTSGSISLADIRAEYGGTGPISLAAYYRGAGLVPPGVAIGAGSFQTAPLPAANGVQIPAAGQSAIQLSHFYGTAKLIPGPDPVLLTNTFDDEFRNWTSPVTGNIFVTMVGVGGKGGVSGGAWGGGSDSGGGSGGGGHGTIYYRKAVSVVKGQTYPYKVRPEVFTEREVPVYNPQTGETEIETQYVATSPTVQGFGIVASTGQPGLAGSGNSMRYSGGDGGSGYTYGTNASGTPTASTEKGGKGGNSRINTQGLPGLPGTSTPWAAGGEGGRAGTGNADQSSPGSRGFGFGAGAGGGVGHKGGDNPDTAGGGGGGAGGFIPPGYPANTKPETTGAYGAMGCIYIEFEESYPG